eukprot:3931989-Rhodomonas_salina.1
MPPPAFPPPPMAAPIPALFHFRDELSKALILTDDLMQFMLWQESFRLRIERVNPNAVWTLIINDLIHTQQIAFLGLRAVQQYANQELMWQWLHEAAKYSEKALPIISHAMANKGQPLFATNEWKAIVRRFNPANAKNAAMQDAAMKRKINSFAGEWREWIQDVLYHHTLVTESGKLVSEDTLASLSSRLNTVAQLCETVEDNGVFAETFEPEVDNGTNRVLAQAYNAAADCINAYDAINSIMMHEEQDVPAPHLHNQHLRRMENGAHPFPGGPARDQLIAQARQAMNELAGARIPPMQHSLEDNPAAAAHHQGNQDGGAGAVLLPIRNVAAQALQASAARPNVVQPTALNSVRPVIVEEQLSNIGSLYCHHCGTLNSNAANAEGNAYACRHCCQENHTDDQCSIEAVRLRQKESLRDHVNTGSEDERCTDSPYPGVKKTVKFKPFRNDQNRG